MEKRVKELSEKLVNVDLEDWKRKCEQVSEEKKKMERKV